MLHTNKTTKQATVTAIILILVAGALRMIQIGPWQALDAQITDATLHVQFTSQGTSTLMDSQREAAISAPHMLTPDIRLQSRPIHAGHVFWKENFTTIHQLNRQLEEDRAILAEENDLIQAENEMKEEQTRQLLNGLTSDSLDFDTRLAQACVLNSYIKRRTNLMLLKEKETQADAAELGLCIREDQFTHTTRVEREIKEESSSSSGRSGKF